MQLQLDGDTAVVVGGAKGIGLAIARQLAQLGVRVALLDVDPAVVEVAGNLAASAATPLGLVADVADLAAVREAARQVLDAYGCCDHLVYAAGVGSGKYGFPFWNLEPADWRRVVDVCLLGAVNVLHAFVPAMIQRRRGTVLLIGSVAGQIGSQTDPPYSAAKAALINFAQCAAKDLAPYDIRVNTICPGMVKTDLNRSVWQAWYERQEEGDRMEYDQWAEAKIRRLVPLGRWQTCEDVAAMAAFLASPRAANITGQTINIDGGQVMH